MDVETWMADHSPFFVTNNIIHLDYTREGSQTNYRRNYTTTYLLQSTIELKDILRCPSCDQTAIEIVEKER